LAWKKVKTRIGRVVSSKMQKTVVVAVEVRKRVPIYNKMVRATRKYKAHDEQDTCETGDLVKIAETRPLSREKRWRVMEVLARGVVVSLPQEVAVAGEVRPEKKEAPPEAGETAPQEGQA